MGIPRENTNVYGFEITMHPVILTEKISYAENIRYNYRDNGYPVWQAPA